MTSDDGIIGELVVDDTPALRDGATIVSRVALDVVATAVADAASRCIDPARDRPDIGLLGDPGTAVLGAFLGLARSGWAVGVLDPGWSDAELAAALAQFDPPALVVTDVHRDRLSGRDWTDHGPCCDGARLLVRRPASRPSPPRPPRPDDQFYVGFTSGSSGHPKAFARSHGSWTRSFAGFDRIAPLPTGALVLVPGPLSSSHFLFGAVHALHAGCCVELGAGPVTDGGGLATRLARDPAPSAVYVVPTMLARLAESTVPITHDVTAFCAGARLPERLRDDLAERHPGVRIVEYYGASELSFVAIRVPGDGTPSGSVGRAFPGVRIVIADDADRPLPAGAAGRIFVRSGLVFDGYRGATPPSAARRRDDMWTVGDRGLLDPDGNLFVSGRGSSLIITGGVNVQPEEVEEAVAAAPGVRDYAVVGTPHAVWGQEVVAVVVPDGLPPDRAGLRAFIGDRLSRAKRPRRYLLAAGPLPLGRTGKVDRDAVGELVAGGGLEELR